MITKGFRDYTDEDAIKRAEIRKILVETFERYCYEPAETPIIEDLKFVKGENSDDEAVSDIYKLKDKGKRNLALRYEFTFQLKRLMKNKKLPYKRYQIGEVFRDEPVSKNRFRQFTQCDIDVVGSSTKDEAEIFAATSEVLKKLGIECVIYFNNRKLLNEILNKEGIKKASEVIKEIDKLDKLPEAQVKRNLAKFGASEVLKIFKKPKSYFEKYDSYKEVQELEEYCKFYSVEVEFQPSLARGLSYYNGTVFEVKTKKFRESICGGGSYMFNNVQCTGISLGLDRLALLSEIKDNKEKVMVLSINQDMEAIKLCNKLRKNGENIILYYGKPSKALEFANSKGISKVIFVGEKEVKTGKFKVKNMKSGRESYI